MRKSRRMRRVLIVVIVLLVVLIGVLGYLTWRLVTESQTLAAQQTQQQQDAQEVTAIQHGGDEGRLHRDHEEDRGAEPRRRAGARRRTRPWPRSPMAPR